MVLINVGYPERTADAYARDVDSIQRDPEVKERVLARDVSFQAGVEAARDNKKAEDPEKQPRYYEPASIKPLNGQS
jgi:hypothetical protein